MKDVTYRRVQRHWTQDLVLDPRDRVVSERDVEKGTIYLIETTHDVPSRIFTRNARHRVRGVGARF